MNWSKVRLIFFRELRDQLRDRRTLFMIVVLPVLLYPLMGMAFLQVAQFMQEQPANVTIVGADSLPSEPKLLDGDASFAPNLYSHPDRATLLIVDCAEVPSGEPVPDWARAAVESGETDVVVVFPPQFGERLKSYSSGDTDASEPPQPHLYFSGAKDRSRIAYERLSTVLARWRNSLVEQTLVQRQLPATAAQPFVIGNQDIAEATGRRAAMWAKLLPFVLILWAVTGAFHPAVDLCAGEKERGTLETLLSSPAERSEIVWGKLLTVTVFSIATSMLNLVSLTTTGGLIVSRLQMPTPGASLDIGPPPMSTMGWLILALVPLAAMFSALSLALATMARSTKEGQYYLMPLMLVTMPLAMLPIMPTTEVNLGTSLIPVTGVLLILRSLIEGQFLTAAQFVLPTAMVTVVCCWFSFRWAVHQFNDESVLFRESERFGIGVWVRHLIRDRELTPSLAEGVMCGIVLLVLQFFVRLMAPAPAGWIDIVVSTLIVQLALVAAPVLIMTVFLTSSATRTLLIRPARFSAMVAAVLLAFFISPASVALRELIQFLYPVSEETLAVLAQFSSLLAEVPTWQIILLMALTPAICEELAFRGFILSGLRHFGSKGTAILISSLFFGIMHAILQQSINAFFFGLVLGYIAVQTGSLLPCILFHFSHNSLQLLSASVLNPALLEKYPGLEIFFVPSTLPGALAYRVPMVVASILATGLLLRWFRSLPFTPSPEERLQDALDHQSTVTVH